MTKLRSLSARRPGIIVSRRVSLGSNALIVPSTRAGPVGNLVTERLAPERATVSSEPLNYWETGFVSAYYYAYL
jgi:hypothetical protein